MTLETITGNLLAYKELKRGTFQHVDQLTAERITNLELRDQKCYTADGEMYTVQRRETLWAITRELQNLVLRNIDEAYPQLTIRGNYFPAAEEAQASLEHQDTVVIEVNGLSLVEYGKYGCLKFGHFMVDPKKVKELNSQQKLAAQRIFGPDEDSFGQNMEMFAEAGKLPLVSVLRPDYVQDALHKTDKKYLELASWLYHFNNNSIFFADDHQVDIPGCLRGLKLKKPEPEFF